MERLLYEKLSNDRNPKFNIVTDIVERDGQKVVIKRPYSDEAKAHIHRVYDCYKGLQNVVEHSVFCVNESKLEGDDLVSEFLVGEKLTGADTVEFVEAIKAAYLPVAEEFVLTDEFKEVFGEVQLPQGVLAARFLDIDLIFDNVMKTDKGWEIMDFEWTFDFPIPINYLLYRGVHFGGLTESLVQIPDAEKPIYLKMEEHFQSEYCFKGIKNLQELRNHIADNNKTAEDFKIASRDYQIKKLEELIAAKDLHIRNIEAANTILQGKYDTIINSKGYKFLEDFRAFKSFVKGEDSPARKAKRERKQAEREARQLAKQNARKDADKLPSVAVHIHLYYVDLLPEFVQYLSNIPFKFDLYISARKDADVSAIKSKLKEIKNLGVVDVRALPNRGRDLAPLYGVFGPEIMKHDYFLHVHSKKSLYSGSEKMGWRQYCLDLLLGSDTQINYILDLFKNENAGLIYPDIYVEIPEIAYSWLANVELGKKLFEEYDLGEMPVVFNYPAGSFFWASTKALAPLFDRGYTYEDFPEEAGQTDGTLAHALERIVPFITGKQGFDSYIINANGGETFKNKSINPYMESIKLDKQLLTMKLGNYNVISFDIFDTLITRTIFEPDDVFKLMGNVIKHKFNIDVDFLKIRKEAEAAATAKYGPMTTIDKIYVEVANNKQLGNVAQDIKKLEIDMETAMCIPKKDMVEVYNQLKAMDKTVILVSDMYLNRVQVVGLLHKCGISYYDELLISCEVGARKDDGTMWDMLMSKYDMQSFIHVGDNFRSDSQIPMEKCISNHVILNTNALLELSEFPYFKTMAHKNLQNSLMIGQALAGGIFNTPFAYEENGQLHFKNIYDFGYTVIGPLLTSFVEWIVTENRKSHERLLLLSREGYMLEQLIRRYCEGRGIEVPDMVYFLTSRRAVSVAALENDEDIRDLASQKYKGTFSNFLNERFGVKLHDNQEDLELDYDELPDDLMTKLAEYKDEILERAKKEKNAYMVYIKEIMAGASDVAVVDVGFSGTIQFFLMKLTGRNIAGHYLALHSNKPSRIGGKADAIYEINNPALIDESKLLKYQLFLENALAAPYGQLINFTMVDGVPKPNYKDDDYLSDSVRRLQQGILDFTYQYATANKGLGEDIMTCEASVVEDLFHDIIAAGTLTEDIAQALVVEDSYCRNGVQKFDVKSGTWKVD